MELPQINAHREEGTKPRRPVLVLALLAMLAAFPVFLFVLNWRREKEKVSATSVEVDLGGFGGMAGERASVRRLAVELKRHPNVIAIEICYSDTLLAQVGLDDDLNRQRIWYDRDQHSLTLSCDGTGEFAWNNVSEGDISNAALSKQSLDVVMKQGNHPMWP